MGLRPKPSQRQRRLGAELRRLRDQCGFTATKAGAEVGLSAAHLNHIEAGRTAIPAAKLRDLASIYGCNNQRLIDSLVAMGQASGRGWWSEFQHPPHSDGARDLAELESMSVRYRAFQWVQVPGLLQTPAYMHAQLRSGSPDASAETIQRFVDFRLRRQRILLEAKPPELHAVIHEAALRMEFVDRDVMERQIEYLVEMARHPHVTIQILPFRANVHQVRFSSPFVCYDAAEPQLSTVYVDHPSVSPFVTDQTNLREFGAAFAMLDSVALPAIDLGAASSITVRRDSLGLVQHLIYDL